MRTLKESDGSQPKMPEPSEAFCKACIEGQHARHLGSFLDVNRRVIYCRCELCIKTLPIIPQLK
jgi:hypothetical protein